MKSKIDYIQVAVNKDTNEIIGYIMPGKPGVMSREYVEKKTRREAPELTPMNKLLV